MEIRIRNNTFVLLPQKAAFWKEQQTLLISDLHIGKIAHFRKAGIAIPQHAVRHNFIRLDALMNGTHDVQRILFTGDLFHSDVNREWDDFCDWRDRYDGVDMQIVLGNHDRLPDHFCDAFRITVHQKELLIPPFTFAHHPRSTFKTEDEYVISGHLHPVIRLSGKANQQLMLPCFYFGAQQAVLPSFGYFTGGYIIDPGPEDEVIAIAQDRLLRLPK